jgi:integrase
VADSGILAAAPAAHVRRPRLDYESHAVALDRNELGAMLVAAGLGPPFEHALISLLALNGLRVSEATAADVEHLGLERGHRTLTITRKASPHILGSVICRQALLARARIRKTMTNTTHSTATAAGVNTALPATPGRRALVRATPPKQMAVRDTPTVSLETR